MPNMLRPAQTGDSEEIVARFKDDQQVYSLIGGMFEDVLADESAGSRMRAVGGTVQWELRRPSARITVRLGDDLEHGVDCGDTGAKPEVVLSMDAETAHRFWAGELPLHVALSRGLIRAKGPVATILRIVPVVGPARELYAARLAGGAGTAAPAEAEESGETQVAAEAGSEADAAVREAEPPAVAEPEAEAPAEPEPEAEKPGEPDVPAGGEEITPS